MEEHMTRPIVIQCCRDGTITHRKRDEPIFNDAAIAVFTVETEEQAKRLKILACKKQYTRHPKLPDEPWYCLPRFSGDIEDLPRVTKMFADLWDLLKL